jgi:hypothetical protein
MKSHYSPKDIIVELCDATPKQNKIQMNPDSTLNKISKTSNNNDTIL